MKTIAVLIAAGAFAVSSFTACSTAHQAAEDTEHVAKKAGHAVGHGIKKTGDTVARGGEKLQDVTSDR